MNIYLIRHTSVDVPKGLSEMPSVTQEYWNLISEIGKCSILIKSKTRISNAGMTTT